MNTRLALNVASNIDVLKTHVSKAFKHDSPVICCRFDPTNRFVFFGAQDNRVWRWDIEADSAKQVAQHESWVRALGYHQASNSLLTGGYDGRLRWWLGDPESTDEPAAARSIEAHDGWIRALALSPDGAMIATVGNDLLVKLWDAADGRLIREMAGHDRHVYHVAFHPDGQQLATGDLMGNLFHWEVASGKLARRWEIKELHIYDKTFLADIGGFRDMRFSSDGKLLACAGITDVTNAFAGIGNPLIVLWDWEGGQPKILHRTKGKLAGVAWGAAVHSEGFTIGVSGGGAGGFLLFWQPDQEEDFHRFQLPNTGLDFDISHDGQRVATAHHDGHVRISRLAAAE